MARYTANEDLIIADAVKNGTASATAITKMLTNAGYKRVRNSVRSRLIALGLKRGSTGHKPKGDESSSVEHDEKFCAAMTAAFESGRETDGGNPRIGVYKDFRPTSAKTIRSDLTRSMVGSQSLSCANA